MKRITYVVYVYRDGVCIRAVRCASMQEAKQYCADLPIDLIGQIEVDDE